MAHPGCELAAADALIQALRQVLHARGDVALALLFGSRARGDAGETSDVDVALLTPATDLLDVGAELSHASGLEVDVISLADPGVPLLDELLRDAVVLYEARPGAYATWRSHVLTDLELDRPWYERTHGLNVLRGAACKWSTAICFHPSSRSWPIA